MNCSYCGKALTLKHTFSYGIPGVKQVFRCSRPECLSSRKSLTPEERVCERLGKTKNNVYVIPSEDWVMHPVYGKCVVITGKRARPWINQHFDNIVPVSECIFVENFE